LSQVPEKNLNRYDVLDRIAVGGMAEVFLAKAYGAHGFEKTLAIKRILPELARDPEFEERFIAEAKVAVRLSHTNVVQVFDFGRFAGSLFIAMEYVDGLDLAALLRRLKQRGEKIPVTAAFQIAIELARGLDFAHQHGVVHRDVSPSNILLSRAGEVKIADFGIAVAATPSRGTFTGRRKVMGKWRYMSPEQARGEPLDTRSDLFSAAAVMHELFTGEKLFPGDEAEDIIRNIHDMPLPRPSEVRPGLPPRLDAILHAALARSPDARPARPAVMLRALIELTYESSIVSTALDVSELVSDLVDSTTPTGKRLDAIIRAQLAGLAESTRARRTAGAERRTAGADPPADALDARRTGAGPHHHSWDRRTAESSVPADLAALAAGAAASSAAPHELDAADEGDGEGEGGEAPRPPPGRAAEITVAARRKSSPTRPPPVAEASDGRPVLISRVDSDGISRLELDETTIAGAAWPRYGEPPPMPPESIGSDPALALPAETTGSAAGSSGETAVVRPAASDPAATMMIGRRPSGRWPWMIGGGTAALAAAAALYLATRERSAPAAAPVAATTVDAGVDAPPPRARLQLTSTPSGARGTVGGAPFGPTPASIDVAPGEVEVRLELPGRAPFVRRYTVAAGQTLFVDANLAEARARLIVVTHPPGAAVLLDGERVGVTPLELTDLAARPRARLTLELDEYLPTSATIDLVAGQPARIERTLRPAPVPLGTIKLMIEDGWGEVYLRGKKVGKAPNQALQLPVGKHRLRIVNPPSGREVWLDVDVSASEVRFYSTRLPG
jgi:serine/threonine protein kinase